MTAVQQETDGPTAAPSQRERDTAAGGRPEQGPKGDGVSGAPRPTDTPGAVWLSVLLCLALVVLGAVLVREALVQIAVAGRVVLPGEPWLTPVLASVTDVGPGTLALLVAAVGFVVGVWMLVLSLKPRRKPLLRLGGEGTPIDVDSRSLASMVSETLLTHPDVVLARAGTRRRVMVVDVTTDPRADTDVKRLKEEAADMARAVCHGAVPSLRTKVRVHGASA